MANYKAVLKSFCLELGVIFVFIGQAFCLDRNALNELFQGDKVVDFYAYCTKESKERCTISSPEDFQRLYIVKSDVKEHVDFKTCTARLASMLIFIGIILALMIHLTVVNHFEWKTLPLIKIVFLPQLRKPTSKDKMLGVRFEQFTWMKYLVLRGNHRAFKGRDIESIPWYKYTKPGTDFDYKEVEISYFTFLDKKSLTKHLVEELEKEAAAEGHIHHHT